jgi:hypothetical protein
MDTPDTVSNGGLIFFLAADFFAISKGKDLN